MQQIRNLIRRINVMERQSYSLYLLKEKYSIQSSIIYSRYEHLKQEAPDSEETKYCGMLAKSLLKIAKELEAAYYQDENAQPWKP